MLPRCTSRVSLALPLATIVLAAGMGCMVDRRPIEGPVTPPDDAWSALDADRPDAYTVVDDLDAWTEPDAPAPSDGGLPDGGPCDFAGDPCCGRTCAAGLRCLTSAVCDVELCGTTAGGPCCLDGECPGSGLVCAGDRSCQSCGGRGEPCCAGSSCDVPTADACNGITCEACGGPGQPCCASGPACAGSAVCESGTCRLPAGSRGGPCRALWEPPQCEAWSQCNFASVCEPCGLRGERCCGAGSCVGGTSCSGLLDGFECR